MNVWVAKHPASMLERLKDEVYERLTGAQGDLFDRTLKPEAAVRDHPVVSSLQWNRHVTIA